MFTLLIGILIGIYLDQLLTIPPLNTYLDKVRVYIDERRANKNFVTSVNTTAPAEKKD